MLFNNDGILNLDEAIAKSPSFLSIMEDGIVTGEELASQTQLVTDLLHEAQERLSGDDVALVERLLTETNVLYAVYQKYQLQNF